jgi:NAD(P)-dependent dehydrogenase (short-subunit alcohol dehydrogenase family)
MGKYALPHLKRVGGGAIVNLASVHALGAHPRYPMYSAAKAGIEPGEILLRLHVAGHPKPVDVRLEPSGYSME